ncbi:hypothetical protein BTR23_25370 [Alkalihalophilus pseudofirmus]|uniref:FbpB family small basic protein n=1 Tax=Alkalihalobacterium alkalinitrilicum TaxID=427920 RepID=UPI00094D4017|nr:FbpB family small basic protein [Alkalihalobacterium alkalinitrilicum]OLO25173.1 hypothetical protein BTR23_25370 [Alkalihalophilus pseudofirmus]
MRKHAPSFEDLVLENKKQLLQDPVALNKIEKRIEERKAKEFESLTIVEKNKKRA